MDPSHRSIVPTIPGVPWWAAVLIATGATAVGYLIDAGHKDLTHVFAGFYITGCVAAVLAVRQAAVFTAVIQPPLILFCTVPGSYWLFHGGKIDKFKDLLINCGYPLIERFPLMLGTAIGVLLIGAVRWFVGKGGRSASAVEGDANDDAAGTGQAPLTSGIVAKLKSLISGDTAEDADEAPPAHSKRRAGTTGRTTRSGSRSDQRPTRARSRHARPDDDRDGERPRRRRSVPVSDLPDLDPADPPRRSRRPRPQDDSERTPRESRRERPSRRNPYEWPGERGRSEPRTSRSYDNYEPPASPGRGERYSRRERRGGYEPYDAYDAYEPGPRRAASNGSNPTHHPISQVRYRGQTPRSERREPYSDEPRSERRSRSRAPRRPQTESWEYEG